jgi:hypothetical protein
LDGNSILGNQAKVVGRMLIYISTKQEFKMATISTNDDEAATFVVGELDKLICPDDFMKVGFYSKLLPVKSSIIR